MPPGNDPDPDEVTGPARRGDARTRLERSSQYRNRLRHLANSGLRRRQAVIRHQGGPS
jgi:hypothetical protein